MRAVCLRWCFIVHLQNVIEAVLLRHRGFSTPIPLSIEQIFMRLSRIQAPGFCTDDVIRPLFTTPRCSVNWAWDREWTANDVPCRPTTLTGSFISHLLYVQRRHKTRMCPVQASAGCSTPVLRTHLASPSKTSFVTSPSRQGPGKCVKVDLLDGDHSPHHACLRERHGPFPVYCWKARHRVCRARSVPPTQQTYTPPSISTDWGQLLSSSVNRL